MSAAIQQTVSSFDQWRDTARRLLEARVSHADVLWHDGRQRQQGLFAAANDDLPPTMSRKAAKVSPRFLELARLVAHHRRPERWALLYRLLWRQVHEARHLLDDALDDDVFAASEMEKQVRRDRHKMRAFVRFNQQVVHSREHYFAWYEPDHYTLGLNAAFFADRFSGMTWSICTPDESAFWDGSEVTWGPGVARDAVPRSDASHDLWRTYYGRIFNPARVKVATMKREMPVRFWKNLPEASIIGDLLAEAPARVATMQATTEGWATSARDWLPQDRSLASLAAAATGCRACPLCEPATQTVFGRGSASASIVLVGEQPGDEEDLAGEPFVGPAGRVLRAALAEIQLPADDLYMTNAVKHFGFEQRGKKRLHKNPRRLDVISCRPWLDAELEAIKPRVVVCLGATALQTLAGPTVRLGDVLGQVFATTTTPVTLATYHPSAILRSRDAADADAKRAELVRALARAKQMVSERG